MLFSSTTFIYLFLPLILLVYYVFLKNYRTASNLFLFVSSLVFYGWGEPKFVFVMMASIAFNWLFGIFVSVFKIRGKNLWAKICVCLACICNLGLLFVFKYLNFAESIWCSVFGISEHIPNIVLPIGISFFTFQAMSYVIDVYRGRGKVQRNILNVGLYIAFFPQLIAGPIVRYETVAYEINNRKENKEDFFDGFARFITGLGKKVLLANTFGIPADKIFGIASLGGELSVGTAWLGAIAYTFQIFFDFSGYSDMAIGLGRMFGFHFLENFDYPYISRSITEFWRRWHMSLGSWFRDYVYIPLGGSRVSKGRLVFNLFAVWLLTGIWHGANLTFVVWGLMYFVLLTLEKLTGFDLNGNKITSGLKWTYTMFFVVMGWVLFRSDSLSTALEYMRYMFGLNGNSLLDGFFKGWLSQLCIMLVFGVLASAPWFKNMWSRARKNIFTDILHIICLAGIFVLCVANLVSTSYNPFIYFNF